MEWPLVLLLCVIFFLVGSGIGKLMGRSETIALMREIAAINDEEEEEK
jgi:hypothetical protein